jgi:hypothetical protein
MVVLTFINDNVDVGIVLVVFAVAILSRCWYFDVTVFMYRKGTNIV